MGVNNRMIITDGVHLTSTENEEELHAFASGMGLKREWFQDLSYSRCLGLKHDPKRIRPHYDLTTPGAVKRAILAGATKVTSTFLLRNSWWAK